MYIESLEVTNFRGFDHARVNFQYRGRSTASKAKASGLDLPNVNLILGDNGTGKSAILKGIILGVLGAIIQSSGFRPYYLVRRTGSEEDHKREHIADVRTKIRFHSQDLESDREFGYHISPSAIFLYDTQSDRRWNTAIGKYHPHGNKP